MYLKQEDIKKLAVEIDRIGSKRPYVMTKEEIELLYVISKWVK